MIGSGSPDGWRCGDFKKMQELLETIPEFKPVEMMVSRCGKTYDKRMVVGRFGNKVYYTGAEDAHLYMACYVKPVEDKVKVSIGDVDGFISVESADELKRMLAQEQT